MLSVELDGLTTVASNLATIHHKRSNLDISLVIVVPEWVSSSDVSFPVTEIGIQYGTFSLADIAKVFESRGAIATPHVIEPLNFTRRMNMENLR